MYMEEVEGSISFRKMRPLLLRQPGSKALDRTAKIHRYFCIKKQESSY